MRFQKNEYSRYNYLAYQTISEAGHDDDNGTMVSRTYWYCIYIFIYSVYTYMWQRHEEDQGRTRDLKTLLLALSASDHNQYTNNAHKSDQDLFVSLRWAGID